MGGIERLSEAISADLKGRFPGQRKAQREKLALLVATMLEVRSANLRSANLMDLAASLPRRSERLDMRYQWIKRLLANKETRFLGRPRSLTKAWATSVTEYQNSRF